jgi:hypothetical protein
MDARQTTRGSRFAVDLGDVKLPDVIEKRVEAEIRAVALRALAEVDTRGARRYDDRIQEDFPGGVAGMWIGPDGDWKPQPLEWPGSGEPLTPRDHTTIIRAIMDHPMEVIKYLDRKERDPKPSDREVLEAALQVEGIDDFVKDLIRRILEILGPLERERSRGSGEVDRMLDELRGQIAGRSIEEKVRVLRDRKTRARYRSQAGVEEGMEVAAQILEDGATSVYSEDHPFYRMLREGKRRAAREEKGTTAGDVADADGIGAAVGGVWGSLAAGVGAGPGAVAAGAAASAGMAISAAIDWIFD